MSVTSALETLLRGEFLDSRVFDKVPREVLYSAVVADPRLPELMDILRVKFPEVYEKINDVLALRRGEFPSMRRATRLVDDYSPVYGIPPKTYVRYLAKAIAEDHAGVYIRVIHGLEDHRKMAKCGLDTPELFPALLEARVRLDCHWSNVADRAYCSAVTSGYLWFLAETSISMVDLTSCRMKELIADFSVRAVNHPQSRIIGETYDRFDEVLIQHISDIARLFTFDSVMRLAVSINKPAAYARLKATLGEDAVEAELLGRLRGKDNLLNVWIRSGGGYTERLHDVRYDKKYAIRESLKVNNAKFLRELILSGEKLPSLLHVHCIKSGHVECVKLALEFKLPITPCDLSHALKNCDDLAIVSLYA